MNVSMLLYCSPMTAKCTGVKIQTSSLPNVKAILFQISILKIKEVSEEDFKS